MARYSCLLCHWLGMLCRGRREAGVGPNRLGKNSFLLSLRMNIVLRRTGADARAYIRPQEFTSF
jgi:hypothetical protein